MNYEQNRARAKYISNWQTRTTINKEDMAGKVRERKPKFYYRCPKCEYMRTITTYLNQKTIEVNRIYCLDCKVEMKPTLINAAGEDIL